jgi:hypothetical protein
VFTASTGYHRKYAIDLVRYDGGNPAGEFCYTLTMTDPAAGCTVH